MEEKQEKLPSKKASLKEYLIELQSFTAGMNTPVNRDELANHPMIKGVQYLPISRIEMRLDEMFFGLWKSENFRWELIHNEIIATIEVSVFHPVAKEWITRSGAMAVKIMTDAVPEEIKNDPKKKNKWALDLDNKKPAALENGGFSKLKAECFKNACLSLGKAFGRDINRIEIAEYHAIIKKEEDISGLKGELSDAIQMCQDVELQKKIVNSINDAELKKVNSPEFYKQQLEKLGL